MASLYEIRAGKHVHQFRDFEQAERSAEDYALKGYHVELHRLVERMNIPGCLPKLVINICRLDVYYVENDHLMRKQCNIF